MSSTTQDNFGVFRSYVWPIHHHELRKLIPMLLMFFFLSLNYNILRNLKDALVVTAPNSGAEVIPFIKVWVMFPLAVLVTGIFAWVSSRLSREKVFYTILSLFLGYFTIFWFLVYPNRDLLHPHEAADRLQLLLPEGLKGFVAMFRYWTFCSFYAVSELWSNIILFLLFWAFANEITQISEAKRFYGLMGLGANLASIMAGQVSIQVSRHYHHVAALEGLSSDVAWERAIGTLLAIVLTSGLASMALYRWMHVRVLNDPRYYCPKRRAEGKKKRPKFSLKDSFVYLRNSPYLLKIAAIVLSYNLVINLVEVLWKHNVRMLYPDPNEYNIYMNQVTTFIGIMATIAALFVSGNSIRRYGWTFTAMITPVILFLTSVGFFGFMFFGESLAPLSAHLFGMTPLAMIVFFGSLQNVMSRGAKYTVYDATKELAFVPLSDECKLKGKTAIDGVGTRLGKSGGSIIHQFLLMSVSSLSNSTPYIAFILLILIGVWSAATLSLGKQFNLLTSQKQKEESTASENADSAIKNKSANTSVLVEEKVS